MTSRALCWMLGCPEVPAPRSLGCDRHPHSEDEEVYPATCDCGNALTIADAPPLCGQCRRNRSGGRAPKVRRASEYERAEYARRRKAGTL